MGYLKVLSYTLPESAIDFTTYKGKNLIRNWESKVSIHDNLISIYYSSGTYSSNYSGILISWEVRSKSSSLSLETIVAIITVSVILFLCFTCCIIFFFKCTKIWKCRRRTPNRQRIYQILPNNSFIIISEDNLNSLIPMFKYTKNLIEVGDSTCSICFEE